MQWIALVAGWALVAGCGRVHFDPLATEDGGPGDVAVDAEGDFVGRTVQYVKASNTGAGDQFGTSVALSTDGTTLAVGAYFEDSGAPGVNGNQADDSMPDSGAVYVFVRAGSTWVQQAYVKASSPGSSDRFGFPVALSADGNTLAVGASGEDSAATGIDGNQADNSAGASGAAYVFTRAGSIWTQQAYLKQSNTGPTDFFGESLALSAQANTLAIGAAREDSAATGVGGNQADDSAMFAGAAYVFLRSGTTWTQQAYIKASNTGANDLFGWSVALTANGNTLAVGAIEEASAATGVGGIQADESAPGAGAVYVFTRTGAAWAQSAYVKASNTGMGDVFGGSVQLAADGTTLAVGAYLESGGATGVNGNQADDSAGGSGAAYVFTGGGSTWAQQAYLKASNTGAGDFFSFPIALSADGSRLAACAKNEDSAATGFDGNGADNSAGDSGAVYGFTRVGTAWAYRAYLKAPNTSAADELGASAVLSADGTTLVVGANMEDSAATGVDGNQADEAAPDSGAVFVFH